MNTAADLSGLAYRHYQVLARFFAWVGIIAIIILSLVPAEDRPLTGFGPPLEHFAAFSLVAAVFAIGYDLSLVRLVLLALVFCAGIELAQIPLPTRHARLSDFTVDFLSCCYAIVLVQFGKRKKRAPRVTVPAQEVEEAGAGRV
jgi:VanZ family protein